MKRRRQNANALESTLYTITHFRLVIMINVCDVAATLSHFFDEENKIVIMDGFEIWSLIADQNVLK